MNRLHIKRRERRGLTWHKTPPAKVLLIGNPNSGKTALFNRLTGAHHKVSNYPGVTVERKEGYVKNENILIQDLPGIYSIIPHSPDEKIVAEIIQSWRNPQYRPDGIIVVLDATNIEKNLYLALQILEWGIPTILALNMMDEVERRGIRIDHQLLQKHLNAAAVVPVSARTGQGIDEIINQLANLTRQESTSEEENVFLLNVDNSISALRDLVTHLEQYNNRLNFSPVIEAMRLVAEDSYIQNIEHYVSEAEIKTIKKLIKDIRKTLHLHGVSYAGLESRCRYRFIDEQLTSLYVRSATADRSTSEKVDTILTHPVWGMAIFIIVLGLVFNAIFSWAEYPMGLIETGISDLSVVARQILPHNAVGNLVSEGIIGGVGNVLVFFPQIILLIFFLGLLEDSGYLARISFILDKLMSKAGLQGKAVLPLLSGFACAIPAIMAARTIENRRERLLVILLIPLMSCSARLPVYTLLISTFIPRQVFWGFIELQGLVLFGTYFTGLFTAMFIAVIIKKFKRHTNTFSYINELPSYRLPILRSLGWRIYDAGKLFLVSAGSIILSVTIVLWFLASYPTPEDPDSNRLKQSYAGRLGHFIEPAVEPLGFDWKIGVGLITSFAAREVIISTFATFYNIDAEDQQAVVPLKEALRNDRDELGRPLYTTLTGISLLVFFIFSAQCISTFAIIRKETNSWRWPFVMLIYMNVLAYTASLIVYQGGKLMGWG